VVALHEWALHVNFHPTKIRSAQFPPLRQFPKFRYKVSCHKASPQGSSRFLFHKFSRHTGISTRLPSPLRPNSQLSNPGNPPPIGACSHRGPKPLRQFVVYAHSSHFGFPIWHTPLAAGSPGAALAEPSLLRVPRDPYGRQCLATSAIEHLAQYPNLSADGVVSLSC